MPTYRFKITPESLWLLVILALGAAVKYLQGLDVEALRSIPDWAPGLVIAVGRPVLGAILDLLNGQPAD